jgi:hypothetical protein
MTYMRQDKRIFTMPRKSDHNAVESHKAAVLDHFTGVLREIDDALIDALPKAKSTFALHEGPVDLAVHAPWTRYLVRLTLEKKSNELIDEDDVEFDMARVSNCGLCIRTPEGEIRVLKSPGEGLPKALSDARVSFVVNNQLVFSFAEEDEAPKRSLNLFVLWKMDADHKYLGMDIACPKTAHKKGDIECYWIASWRRPTESVISSVPQGPVAPDLDEIVAVPARNIKTVA